MDQLTSYQISEWEAYDQLDPIGEWRDDFRMASIMAQMRNLITWAHAKKGSENTCVDFMPDWDVTAPKEQKKQSVDEMKQVFKDIVKAQKVKNKMKIGNRPPPSNIEKK